MFVKKECIYLGKITRTHGIHGQMVLATELTLATHKQEEPILVELDGGLVPFYLDKSELKQRDHQSYLIKFDHISTREQAEKYVNAETYLLSHPRPGKDKFPTEKALLKNFSIYDASNVFVGKVNDVLDFSGNTLFQLFIEDKEVLLPFTESHILDWNSEERKIKLQIPEGLLDL